MSLVVDWVDVRESGFALRSKKTSIEQVTSIKRKLNMIIHTICYLVNV